MVRGMNLEMSSFPTLYVKSKRDSKYRTLSGQPVEEVHPGTVRDCREFYKRV